MITATASEKALANWYDAAAWVVHLDRLVGLEAFADPSAERTILEYEEGADPATFGYDGITGTRHIQPYLRAMLKAFEGFAQPDPEAAHALMRKLEAVSGRWALQLVQSSLTKVFERAGTACAVRYLADVENVLRGDAGVLNALVSLEEILPGFPATGVPRRLVASRAGRGPMCDDLLLVSVQSSEGISPVVQATVVEVKFWNAEAADYSTAGEQVEETIDWLDTRFNVDPAVKDLRGRDLAELIRSSCSRNSAFGLSPALSAHSESVLAEISQGRYELRFGHWRDGAYRRGLIAAVEPARAGGFELSQLNGPNGPIDLVSIREDLVRQAIEMKPLNTPEGWAVLRMSAPPDESSALADVSSPPDPDTDESGKPEATSSISESTGSVRDASEADETGVRRRERQAPIEEISADANRLNDAFAKYGLSIEPFQPDEAQVGPSVIRFRTRTLGRLSIADIERRSRDISREVGAPGEITIGDEPGKITVDVPRLDRQPVPLRDALNALDEYERQPGALVFVAGVAPNGEVRIADLSRLPHLLVAGATGSGKSVFLRSLLIELFRSRTPQQLRVMIIDPKRLDFSPLNSSPYLEGGKVISDPDHALELLRQTLEREINARQVILEGAGVSSAAEFYEQGGALEALPQFVILVDEFADLVLAGTDRRGFSEMVQRYAQIARAFGIFLVLATQRPSVDVITGSIKANLTARIAFSLPSGRDSMTILDRTGAEDLLGDGDLLFYYNGRVDRLQSPFATLEDLRAVLR